MKEIWKPIPGYEKFYEASNLGRIRSCSRWIPCARSSQKHQFYHGRVLKTTPQTAGYLAVHLSTKGVVHTSLVHRLVALTFIPNPTNLREINHKNGIKTDNCISNLEWISSSENKKHAYKKGLYSHQKSLRCIETGEVFRNQKEAGEKYGVHPNTIGKVCLGKHHTCRGLHFEFL